MTSSSRPPLTSCTVALAGALGALVLLADVTYALVAGVVGVLVLGVGLRRGRVDVFNAGAGLIGGALLLAGVFGIGEGGTLLAAVALVLAWDAGRYGFRLAREAGPETSTRRVEAVHTLSTLVVLVLGASVGYAVFRSSTGDRPLVALAALLVGAVALLVAARR
ncbi:DUF7519 family protein [Halarchaeum sp. P4]|uniref:DUF7519 family protein n=1 Tax=Halarchaeum sp. P4 TaxID=3421639 RepID=UPI003EB8BCB5